MRKLLCSAPVFELEVGKPFMLANFAVARFQEASACCLTPRGKDGVKTRTGAGKMNGARTMSGGKTTVLKTTRPT